MNALYQDLLNQNINNVKIIAIGREEFSSNNGNWTNGKDIPVLVDQSPYNTWSTWEAYQRALYFLDSEGNYHTDFNITTWDYDYIYNEILGLLPSEDINGCTDPEACNYDETATIDDSSCLYNDCLGECGGGPENCPDWEDTPNAYEFTAVMNAQVLLDGISIAEEEDMLAAFDRDGNVRGLATQEDGIGPFAGQIIYEIIMRSNAVGDLLTFQYYDASEYTVLDIAETYEFVINDNIGSLIDPVFYHIVADTTIVTVEYYTGLQSGSNLQSFYILPEDASVENMFSPLSGQLGAILGEGTAAIYTDGSWNGSLTSIDVKSGYWLSMLEEADFSFNGYAVDPGMEYSLHAGYNLISFPSPGSLGISEGIPDEIEDQFLSILGEGIATVNIDGIWVGSLQTFEGTKGYWVTVQSELTFSFDLTNLSEDVTSRVSTAKTPAGYEYKQSSKQAFYFIEDISGINPGEWILAYNGDVVIGARQWTGEIIDVPAMGNDGIDFTAGYMKSGSTPQFKLLSGDKLIDLTGEVPSWSNNGIYMVKSLMPLPESVSLSAAYPNPFNPVTTLSFALPIESDVTLSIYNLQGREVSTLINGNIEAGYHSVVWNADNNSSGIYFVKMVAGEYINIQKLMLVK